MNKQLLFFCPNVLNDGLKTTLDIYLKYFSKYFDVCLITNTPENKFLKNFNKKIKVINPKIKFLNSNNFLNIIFCTFLVLKNINKNSIVFSMHNHLLLLLSKYFVKNLKVILRTPNAIMNNKKNIEYRYLKKQVLFNNLFINLYKNSDLIVTFSKKNQLYLAKKLQRKNVIHIYNYFKKNSGKKKIKKIYNIFFVGTLSFIKNPKFFLNNCIELLKKKKIKIHIVGDGPDKKELLEISKNFQKDIVFYNHVDRPFKKLSKNMDLVCITSRYDGTPNVLGEAMSYNIPCVAPKEVGLCNILLDSGKFGYLYSAENNKSFKNKVLFALKNYKTSITKAQHGHNSLERFNLKNTLGKLRKEINKI